MYAGFRDIIAKKKPMVRHRPGGRIGLAHPGAVADSHRMEWSDEGVLLSTRPQGETSALVEVLTAEHGRHAGIVRGGASSRMAATLQPGTQVSLVWRARLEDHLGTITLEPLRSRAGLMADRLSLAGLGSVTALLLLSLPEREAHPQLWQVTPALLDRMMHGSDWGGEYLGWELILLEELGFGLDLTQCAVTGSREGLAYVSPRTGRAVSRDAAGDWAARLLPLPAILGGAGEPGAEDLAQGLALTAHFLTRELEPRLQGRPLPEARRRLVEGLTRQG
jgi:DNA repair protein RecO (recombination protein O)